MEQIFLNLKALFYILFTGNLIMKSRTFDCISHYMDKVSDFRQWANCYFKLWYSALSTASFYNHWRQIVSTQTYVNEKSFLHRL